MAANETKAPSINKRLIKFAENSGKPLHVDRSPKNEALVIDLNQCAIEIREISQRMAGVQMLPKAVREGMWNKYNDEREDVLDRVDRIYGMLGIEL